MKHFPGYMPFPAEASDGDQAAVAPTKSAPTNFAELMDLHDVDFVNAAYPIMLARPTDPIGLNYYVNRLRRGHGRISVLEQLARSNEACDHWHAFPGIREAVMKFRASRRLKGWKVALADIEFGRTPGLQRLRALQNSIGADRQRLEKALVMLSRQQDILKYLVSNFGMEHVTDGGGSAERRDLQKPVDYTAPEIRSRRIEEVRSFDLPSSARAAINALRF